MNDGYVELWNNWSKRRSGIPVYDRWLDKYKDVLDKNEVILDLGCGLGANTLYLKELGYNVIASDFANDALDNVRENIKDVETLCFDMRDKFPIRDKSFKIVVADLSLHYFNDKDTKFIMSEIKRVLKNDGVLLARVARVDDYNFGACEGEELEPHYYFEGAYTKRFFDEEDILEYFKIIGDVSYNKTAMIRDEEEYSKEKMLFEVKVVRGED